jgi:hypothetical protein
MYCAFCGTETQASAAFCHACGKPIATSPVEHTTQLPQPQPTYRSLRVLNWVIVSLFVPGAALILLRAPQASGFLFGILIFAIILAPFLIAAVVLSPNITSFAGFPVFAYRDRLRKIGVVSNLVLGVLAAAGLVACLITGQFGPMSMMLIYVLPPALNFKALRELGKTPQ